MHPTRPRSRPAEARDQRVFDAVRELLATQGMHLSMDAVAAYVGCSKQTLYSRYGSKRELLSLSIKPEAVDPDDVEMLEDMVMAAVNEALRLGEETREKTMAALAPGGMGGLL